MESNLRDQLQSVVESTCSCNDLNCTDYEFFSTPESLTIVLEFGNSDVPIVVISFREAVVAFKEIIYHNDIVRGEGCQLLVETRQPNEWLESCNIDASKVTPALKHYLIGDSRHTFEVLSETAPVVNAVY